MCSPHVDVYVTTVPQLSKVCVCVCVCVCVYISLLYACVCVRIQLYKHTDTYTYQHTLKQQKYTSYKFFFFLFRSGWWTAFSSQKASFRLEEFCFFKKRLPPLSLSRLTCRFLRFICLRFLSFICIGGKYSLRSSFFVTIHISTRTYSSMRGDT
jgi:hypothetical protein